MRIIQDLLSYTSNGQIAEANVTVFKMEELVSSIEDMKSDQDLELIDYYQKPSKRLLAMQDMNC